jgi:hypothetical protein
MNANRGINSDVHSRLFFIGAKHFSFVSPAICYAFRAIFAMRVARSSPSFLLLASGFCLRAICHLSSAISSGYLLFVICHLSFVIRFAMRFAWLRGSDLKVRIKQQNIEVQ